MHSFQSYDEFIDLAEKGDRTKVSQTARSSVQTDAKTDYKDVYADVKDVTEDHVIFNFGHAVFEDLGT